MSDRHTSPESFWQEILPADAPTHGGYPARLEDGRILLLPIRHLPDGKHALASLIINQASFEVVDAIAAHAAPPADGANGTEAAE